MMKALGLIPLILRSSHSIESTPIYKLATTQTNKFCYLESAEVTGKLLLTILVIGCSDT